ncbi:ABC transporter substrate-binding protein [Occultella kanbiaonis]|uniref:ABC transporter substrate-binding protein n=1 Tax=Occultella kanbiaonis TaxID=2675754 RepID=UPI0012B81C2C|nr:extracellular solute-binding protein [Occultella kanbiaonis]
MRARPLIAAAAVLATAALGLAGCSGETDDRTALSFFSWDNEETMAPIIAAFEEENPDVRIEFSNAPPVAEYISTLQTRILSGTAADVFVIAAENKTNLIEGQYVLDLTDEPFMENAAEFNTRTYSADGRAYGLSLASWGSGILYNEDLLAEVGADSPPQTWDEFLALCADLQAAGIAPYLQSVTQMTTTISAFIGAQDAAMDNTLDAGIFDGTSSFAETWTEPLTEYNRLWTEGLVTTDVVGLTGEQVRDEFINGRVAMIDAGPWDLNPIREAAPDLQMSMVPVPALPGSEPFLSGAASPGYAINSASENLDEAKAFLAFLGRADIVEMYNTATAAITTTSDFEPVIDPALAPIVEAVRAGQVYLPQIAWTRNEDILNTEAVAQLQLMVQGQVTPEQVAQALDQKLADSDG